MSGTCRCGAQARRWPVLHHMPCAYVGPAYDFAAGEAGYTCPKCGLEFTRGGDDSEVLGHAWKCPACGAEWQEEMR